MRLDGKDEILEPGSSVLSADEGTRSTTTSKRSSAAKLVATNSQLLSSGELLATPTQLPQPGQLSLVVANAVHGGGSGEGGAGGGGGGVLTAGGSATQRKALRERRKGGGVLGTQVSLLSKEVIHTVEPLNRLSFVERLSSFRGDFL